MAKSKYTQCEKYKILDEIVNGFLSYKDASKKYQIATNTLHQWRARYNLDKAPPSDERRLKIENKKLRDIIISLLLNEVTIVED